MDENEKILMENGGGGGGAVLETPADGFEIVPAADEAEAPTAPAPNAPTDAEIERQMAELWAFDPQAGSLSELLNGANGEKFRENAAKTGDLLSAYKLTMFDELVLREADRRVRAAGGREHLRASPRTGGFSASPSADVVRAYRIFDPDASLSDILRYEAKYRRK